MKICFHSSDKPRERELAEAFLAGARANGHEGWIEPLTGHPVVTDCDLACMVGVKSVDLFMANQKAGRRILYFDKGYIRSRRADSRTWEYWRVSLDAHHPTGTTLMRDKQPADRFETWGIEVAKWRRHGLQIVFAGSSAKYHQFYGLPDPTAYAKGIIKQLLRVTDRPIVYRPKPSWRDAVPIRGSRFSNPNENLNNILINAHVMITHGSNACFESMIYGVPCIVLGDAVARPISSTTLDDLENPNLGKRIQWMQNLAYHQWTLAEFRSGEAWQTIGGWIVD